MNNKIAIALTVLLTIAFGLYLYNSEAFGTSEPNGGTTQQVDKDNSTDDSPGEAKEGSKNKKNPIQATSGKEVDKPKEKVSATPAEPSYLNKTITINAQGLKVVTNPEDLMVLVNKNRSLPADYQPSDLEYLNIPFSAEGDSPKRYLRRVAAKAIKQLFEEAQKEGINLVGVSGFRSYDTQKSIFNNNVAAKGESETSKFSARPGQSEHQTGLAIDVSTASMNYLLEQSFGETKEGRWVKANAAEFGFIVRYLKDKEAITGYNYEPWHLRYVGVAAAKEITAKGLTLEEYLSRK